MTLQGRLGLFDNSAVADERRPAGPRSRPLTLVALESRFDGARQRATGGRRAEVTTEHAVAIVTAGLVCCTLAWRVAPIGRRSDALENWSALVFGTLFWMFACAAALGLLARLRRGVQAALACACSMLGAVVVDAWLDSSLLGLRWCAQLACAVMFAVVCVRVLRARSC